MLVEKETRDHANDFGQKEQLLQMPKAIEKQTNMFERLLCVAPRPHLSRSAHMMLQQACQTCRLKRSNGIKL